MTSTIASFRSVFLADIPPSGIGRDNTAIILLVVVLLAALAVVIALVLRRRRGPRP